VRRENRKPFSEAMAVLLTYYGGTMSPEIQELYWRNLEPYPWQQVEWVLAEAVRRCKWMPRIAELLEFLEGDPVLQAEHAWGQFWAALQTDTGTYSSVYFEDRALPETIRRVFRSWPEAGWLPRSDSENGPMYQVMHKQFLAVYQQVRRDRQACPAYLVGIFEADNRNLDDYRRGLLPEPGIIYVPRQGPPKVRPLSSVLPEHPIALALAERLSLPERET
jgi:hypothetical protein